VRINKLDFAARNLTSNADLFLLFENAKANRIFELIDIDLVFDDKSANKIKMNHIKTMLCGHFIEIDNLVFRNYSPIPPLSPLPKILGKGERDRDVVDPLIWTLF
jgi:hypothetical protein